MDSLAGSFDCGGIRQRGASPGQLQTQDPPAGQDAGGHALHSGAGSSRLLCLFHHPAHRGHHFNDRISQLPRFAQFLVGAS